MKACQKHSMLLPVLFILISGFLTAQSASDNESTYFNLNPLTDGLLLGSGLLLNIGDRVIEDVTEPENGWFFNSVTDISKVNSFDRLFILPFSGQLDTAFDIFTYSALLAPAILLAVPDSKWITIGTMYTESILWAWGLKELGKNLAHRNRPYMYFNDYPQDEIKNGDFQQSFPSGHTTLAFTGASFCTYVFGKYFENSPWKVPVLVATFTLAVGSATGRVASGNHFVSDVLAGAAIGTFSGFIVPWLHTMNNRRGKGKNTENVSFAVAVGFTGINVKLSF